MMSRPFTARVVLTPGGADRDGGLGGRYPQVARAQPVTSMPRLVLSVGAPVISLAAAIVVGVALWHRRSVLAISTAVLVTIALARLMSAGPRCSVRPGTGERARAVAGGGPAEHHRGLAQ